MTDKTQAALKLALEALEDFEDATRYDNEQDDIGSRICCGVLSYSRHSKDCKTIKAITAIREALADHIPDATKMMEPARQQEPVAWISVKDALPRAVRGISYKASLTDVVLVRHSDRPDYPLQRTQLLAKAWGLELQYQQRVRQSILRSLGIAHPAT